jgi:hypothetical protein
MKCANRSWQELQLHNRNLRIGLKRPSQAKSSGNKQAKNPGIRAGTASICGRIKSRLKGKKKEALIPLTFIAWTLDPIEASTRFAQRK